MMKEMWWLVLVLFVELSIGVILVRYYAHLYASFLHGLGKRRDSIPREIKSDIGVWKDSTTTQPDTKQATLERFGMKKEGQRSLDEWEVRK